MDLRQQYRAMSLEVLNATLARGKLNDDEERICQEVIAEKTAEGKEANTPRSPLHQDTEIPNDYRSSIVACKFLSFIGWMAVWGSILVAGVLVYQSQGMFRYASTETIFLGILGVLGTAGGVLVSGLLLVIAGQAARAVMDNANYSRRMLEKMN